MTLERRCRVREVDADSVMLEVAEDLCAGCMGCGGRCALIPGNAAAIRLSHAQLDDPLAEGDLAMLSLDEAALRNEALRGYGLPTLGLIIGAIVGWLLATAWHSQVDVVTALGALAGTFSGLFLSKSGASLVCRARSIRSSDNVSAERASD